MYYAAVICVVLTIVSLLNDRDKTLTGLQIALKRLRSISIPVMYTVGMVTIAISMMPENTVATYLKGGSLLSATIISSLVGSVTVMSGFIAFPLCAILKEQGVPNMVIASFATSLMMVGILSFPLENHFFGTKIALVRNCVSYLIVLIIALVTGLAFGEVAL